MSRSWGRDSAASLVLAFVVTACAPESGREAAVAAEMDALLQTGEALYSQKKEELIIRHFFRDRRAGVFVDVGAFHWKQGSTTLYLEKHLDWTGVAVEPIESLRTGYEKNRPGTRLFQYIVTNSSGGIATLHLAGPVSSTDPEWKNQFRFTKGRELETVEVPTITLDDLLESIGNSSCEDGVASDNQQLCQPDPAPHNPLRQLL